MAGVPCYTASVAWRIIANYALASAAAAGVIALVSFAPSRPLLFFCWGSSPSLVWLPRHWIQLDAAKTPHALISGFLVTLVNLTAGVAGPLLDIFFVRTALTRHQIVATKAATQVFSHLAKILVYGTPLLLAAKRRDAAIVGLCACDSGVVLGTIAGSWVLDRISDVDFKRWTAWIVTGIGLVYLGKAAQLFL